MDIGLVTSSFNTQILEKNKTSTPEAFLCPFPVSIPPKGVSPFSTSYKWNHTGNSLAVQRLGLHTFTAEDTGSIPGWETKIPQAAQYSQKIK